MDKHVVGANIVKGCWVVGLMSGTMRDQLPCFSSLLICSASLLGNPAHCTDSTPRFDANGCPCQINRERWFFDTGLGSGRNDYINISINRINSVVLQSRLQVSGGPTDTVSGVRWQLDFRIDPAN